MFYSFGEDSKCAGCGVRNAVDDHFGLVKGWGATEPRCGHGVFLLCRDCRPNESLWQCPECGCKDSYA